MKLSFKFTVGLYGGFNIIIQFKKEPGHAISGAPS